MTYVFILLAAAELLGVYQRVDSAIICQPNYEIKCKDFDGCYEIQQKCDGRNDCGDKSSISDEEECTKYTCPPSFTKCNDGLQCIKSSLVCDGVVDGLIHCNDESDSKNCENKACPEGYTKCEDNTQCIDEKLKCNGENKINCIDKSDENATLCAEYDCLDGFIKCDDNVQCINKTMTCDGDVQCVDKSDEEDCENKNCLQGYTKCADKKQCIHKTLKCDGIHKIKCNDRSDENATLCKEYTCPDGYKKCQKEKVQCMDKNNFCNGEKTCIDLSDEDGCTSITCPESKTNCADGTHCYNTKEACDGTTNCPDESDEEQKMCMNYKCIAPKIKCGDNLQCISQIQMCNGNFDCDDKSDEAHTTCETYKCPSGYLKCKDKKQCLHDFKFCDPAGKVDCNDGTDEDDCHPTTVGTHNELNKLGQLNDALKSNNTDTLRDALKDILDVTISEADVYVTELQYQKTLNKDKFDIKAAVEVLRALVAINNGDVTVANLEKLLENTGGDTPELNKNIMDEYQKALADKKSKKDNNILISQDILEVIQVINAKKKNTGDNTTLDPAILGSLCALLLVVIGGTAWFLKKKCPRKPTNEDKETEKRSSDARSSKESDIESQRSNDSSQDSGSQLSQESQKSEEDDHSPTGSVDSGSVHGSVLGNDEDAVSAVSDVESNRSWK